MHIGGQVTLFIVIVNFTLLDDEMPNAEIEHIAVLRIIGALRLRQVCAPLAIDEHANRWMRNAQLIDVPTAVQERTDSHLHAERVRLEQWRAAVGRSAVYNYIVEFDARPHSLPVEREIPELYLASQRLTGFFLCGSQQVAVEPVTV